MAEESEQERLASLAKAEIENAEAFLPGSFGCHEALHAASIMTDAVARNLLEHEAILLDPEFYRLASAAHTALFDLYQAIGAKHLSPVDDD
ncbi:hypothetical protein JJB09_24645 [Rhizobium sp. KVB221]|uniref:Uncharacterized protein n=1 Tax=Rhizobium setariae TaxID=2801340 RepID=A0A936YR06_9HYPH|nr:hypothetical protein [Rhizobium setariae]MBL0375209.1 hypothetical protein [Rhizobium setariae]